MHLYLEIIFRIHVRLFIYLLRFDAAADGEYKESHSSNTPASVFRIVEIIVFYFFVHMIVYSMYEVSNLSISELIEAKGKELVIIGLLLISHQSHISANPVLLLIGILWANDTIDLT